jgi:cytoskeletal protein CcmA (bactofilin family)
MWNRRKDEEVQPRPLATPPATQVSREAQPALPPAAASRSTYDEPAALRGGTMIGKSVVVKGHISSREDLYLDGELEGTLEAKEHKLTVGPNGKVTTTSIAAKEILVMGTVQGDAEASDRIEIRKDARLVGNVRAARIMIEDGAYFKGNVDIIRAEAKPTPPPPKPAAPPAAEAPKQQPLSTGGDLKK